MAYAAATDSIYLVGHDHHQLTAEISIPTLVESQTLDALNTATVLQNFADITEGKLGSVDDGTVKVGDLLVFGGKLYGTAYSYYDADNNQQLSSFSHSLDLDQSGSFDGMFKVGALNAGVVSGYMAHVPQAWQAKLGGPALIGQCCIPIVSRTSYGPAAFVFDPAQLGKSDPAPATPLVYYPSDHPLDPWDSTSTRFNGTSWVGGMVLPEGSRSLLFIGTQGTGPFCYGTGQECNDPVVDSKGTHAYPYRSQVWAYDLDQLLRVKAGELQPWDVQPYAIWELILPFANGLRAIAGVTYDPKKQLIYLSQHNTDGTLPTIHALQLTVPE
jgi:hypothetical protein